MPAGLTPSQPEVARGVWALRRAYSFCSLLQRRTLQRGVWMRLLSRNVYHYGKGTLSPPCPVTPPLAWGHQPGAVWRALLSLGLYWRMLFGKTRAGYIPLIDHDAEPPMPLLIPAATAESHLRNVLQAPCRRCWTWPRGRRR